MVCNAMVLQGGDGNEEEGWYLHNAMEHEKASAALEYAEREMREKVTESACACRSYSGSADSILGTPPAVPVSAVRRL